MVEEAQVHAPTLIIIGGVVTLRDKLDWFEGGTGSASGEAARISMDNPD